MKWSKLGRVFVGNGQSEWIHSHGSVPFARALGDYWYRVYFTPRDRLGRSNVSWLDIDIRRPTEILRVSERPLLEPGPLGCFDDNGAMGCWILEHGGNEYLYYQGWNLGVTVAFYVSIGLAVRPIGRPDQAFERIGSGPIFERGLAEPVFVAAPAVLLENGSWTMYYQSGKPWSRSPAGQPLPSYDIRSTISADGVRWNPEPRECITFAHPGEVAIARFSPLREEAGYRGWYSYRGNDWGYQIGYAVSDDGVLWTRKDEDVGIHRDPDSWEGSMIAYPYVFDTEIGRFMLYNGGRYGDAGFGIAVLDED